LSYVDPAGLNHEAKIMHDFNLRNDATDYRSGQELHMDYAVGWGFDNGWVVGLGGTRNTRPPMTVKMVSA
jgi:hypothetical protein